MYISPQNGLCSDCIPFCKWSLGGFWRRKWQPTPVFLPGEFHGQKNLAGPSPWGCKESDTTEWLTYTPSVRWICAKLYHILGEKSLFLIWDGTIAALFVLFVMVSCFHKMMPCLYDKEGALTFSITNMTQLLVLSVKETYKLKWDWGGLCRPLSTLFYLYCYLHCHVRQLF